MVPCSPSYAIPPPRGQRFGNDNPSWPQATQEPIASVPAPLHPPEPRGRQQGATMPRGGPCSCFSGHEDTLCNPIITWKHKPPAFDELSVINSKLFCCPRLQGESQSKGGDAGGAEVLLSCLSTSTAKPPAFSTRLACSAPIAKLAMKPSRDVFSKKKKKSL